ncbi:MAG: hypothetical protein IPI05_06595 [Flavobacteriales bacterium]|nr:hypothetical protein [Flavobacteriales bacterium]
MTTLELRAEIKQLLSREKNTSVLEAIRMLLRREDAETDDDFTDEELAELEQDAPAMQPEKASRTLLRNPCASHVRGSNDELHGPILPEATEEVGGVFGYYEKQETRFGAPLSKSVERMLRELGAQSVDSETQGRFPTCNDPQVPIAWCMNFMANLRSSTKGATPALSPARSSARK